MIQMIAGFQHAIPPSGPYKFMLKVIEDSMRQNTEDNVAFGTEVTFFFKVRVSILVNVGRERKRQKRDGDKNIIE